jgi:hypothetical protein
MKSVHELPSLLNMQSDEELDAKSLEFAKYFTIVQIRPGGFARLGTSNYIRREAPNFAVALDIANALYKDTGKSCLIYAVVDFAGARNFTRHITNIPPVGPVSRRDRDARDLALKN